MTATYEAVLLLALPSSPTTGLGVALALGLRDSRYEVTALVRRDGGTPVRTPLRYAGTTSLFAASIALAGPGAHDILVSVFDPKTGSAALDRTTVIVDAK